MTKLHTHTVIVRAMSVALGLALTLILLPDAQAQEDRDVHRDRAERRGQVHDGQGDRSREELRDLAIERRRGGSHEERERMMKQRMTRLQHDLQLNDQQLASLQPILAEQQRKMEAIRQEHGGGQGNREGMRAAMQQLRTTTNAQVAAILTDAQFKRFKEQQQHNRGGRGEGRGPRGGEGHGPRGGGPDGGHRGPPPHRPGDNPER